MQVSPLVVLFCWGVLGKVAQGANGPRFLALAQVTGSAAMPVVTGCVFAGPLMQVLHLQKAQAALDEAGIDCDLQTMEWQAAQGCIDDNLPPNQQLPKVNIGMTICVCLAGSVFGQGVVGLLTKSLLSDPSLPAPEAQACVTLIKTATEPQGRRPALCVSLLLACLTSLLSPLLVYFSLAKANVTLFAMETAAGKAFEVQVPFSPVYIGIGARSRLPLAGS